MRKWSLHLHEIETLQEKSEGFICQKCYFHLRGMLLWSVRNATFIYDERCFDRSGTLFGV